MLFPEPRSHGPESHTPMSFPWMSSSKLTSFQSHCSWMFSTYYPHGLMPQSYLSECEFGEENLSWLICLVWDGDYTQFVTLYICSVLWKCSKDFVTRRAPYSWAKFAFLWFLLKVNTVFPQTHFFIILLSLGARTIHHLMNHRFPGRILRFVPHSIQIAKNLQPGQRSGKKNLIHRSLRFSPYVTNEESIIGFTNAFQKYIIPICTNPHPNQDTQLIQGTKYLSPYKWILGSFYVALKIQAIISCLFWEYAGGCSSNPFWASGCWWRLRDHSMQILCCKG